MGRRGEQRMVPAAEFGSYYGTPIINRPVWKTPDVPGYLFLGGVAAGSSLLGAGAHATGRSVLATRSKVAALVAIAGSGAALVHDLGRPARFLNMLRTFKPSSPMSMGSWLLVAYSGPTAAAALSDVTGRAPRIGGAATAGAAALAPAIAGYTAALLAGTAVPAWRDARRDLPFVFVGSASSAAGGLGLLTAGAGEDGPARRLATLGWAVEAASVERMERSLGVVGDVYATGRAGRYLRAGKVCGAVGVAAAQLGRRSRAASLLAGAALLGGSLATRFGVLHAGLASADDPRYTVVPQRDASVRHMTGSGWG